MGDALGIQAQIGRTNPIRTKYRTQVRQPQSWQRSPCAEFVPSPVGSTPKSVHYWQCLLLNGRYEDGWLTQPKSDRLTGRLSTPSTARICSEVSVSVVTGKTIVSDALREVLMAKRRCDGRSSGISVRGSKSSIRQPSLAFTMLYDLA
jgi:hypothetical protein